MSDDYKKKYKQLSKRFDEIYDENIELKSINAKMVIEKHELLKRLDGHLSHHTDCVSRQDITFCDCAFYDLLEDLQKEK